MIRLPGDATTQSTHHLTPQLLHQLGVTLLHLLPSLIGPALKSTHHLTHPEIKFYVTA